jgi:hypothetical protein
MPGRNAGSTPERGRIVAAGYEPASQKESAIRATSRSLFRDFADFQRAPVK